MCPHAWHHVSLCYSPHALSACVLMHAIMSPYAILHMVCIAFSSWLKSCLHHMLFSTWFAWHSPHARHHVSICYSPHAWHDILHMLGIMSPHAILLIVWVHVSSCFKPYITNKDTPWTNHEDTFSKSVRTHGFVHMLFDTWFCNILLML